ncbi:MAG: hypothetical protein LBH00_04595, partial [Planctomycetaceae bacterium]|nr:hypothetical protein [Planctomycetaceae bacterium]
MRNIFCGFLFVFAAFAGSEPVFGGGTISVSGTPKTGQKLTATSTGTFTGNFLWVSANAETAADWTKITSGIAGTPNELWEMFASRLTPVTKGVAGANNSELTLDTALAGKYVWVARIDSSGNYAASSPLGPVAATPLPAGSVFLGGITETGQILTATSNGTLTGNFVWTSANSKTAAESEWTPFTSGVGGTNNSKLTLGDALVGKYVRVSRGGVVSVAVGPIKATPVPCTVSISGTPKTGGTIMVTSTGSLSGNFIWMSAASKTAAESEWKLISSGVSGANNSELTLVNSLAGQYIRAARGGVMSNAVGPVLIPSSIYVNLTRYAGQILLTAESFSSEFVGVFHWEYADSAAAREREWIPITHSTSAVGVISKTNNSELTLSRLFDGLYIRAKRTTASGTVMASAAVGPVMFVSISGTPEVGKKLAAASIGGGFTGIFLWESADSATATEWEPVDSGITGTDSSGQIDNSGLILNTTLEGKWIRVKRNNTIAGEVVSDPVKIGPPSPGTVYIDGILETRKTLTAISVDGQSPFTG